MPKHVLSPEGVSYELPDDATDAEIEEFLNAQQPTPPTPPTPQRVATPTLTRAGLTSTKVKGRASRGVDPAWQPVEHDTRPGALAGFAEQLGITPTQLNERFNPMEQARGMARAIHEGDYLGAAEHAPVIGPAVGLVRSLFSGPARQREAAMEELGKGNYSKAGGHAFAAAVPLIGPAAADIGEEYGDNTPHAVGRTAGLLLPMLAGARAGSGASKATARAGVERDLAAARPVRRTVAETRGPTATIPRVVEKITEHSLAGSPIYDKFRRAALDDVEALAARTIRDISGYKGAPEQLGKHVVERIDLARTKLDAAANKLHGEVDLEATPPKVERVTSREVEKPTGILDERGNPVTRKELVTSKDRVRDESSGVWVDTAGWKQAASELAERYNDPSIIIPDAELAAVREQLSKVAALPDSIPWDAAKTNRSLLLKAARRFDEPIPGMRAGVSRSLAGNVDAAMEEALNAAGRTDLAEKWRAANALTRSNKEIFNESVIGELVNKNPEAIGEVLRSRSTSLEDVRLVKQYVGPELFDAIGALNLEGAVGRSTRVVRGGTGTIIDPQALATEIYRLYADGKGYEMYTPETTAALKRVQDEVQQTKLPHGIDISRINSPANANLGGNVENPSWARMAAQIAMWKLNKGASHYMTDPAGFFNALAENLRAARLASGGAAVNAAATVGGDAEREQERGRGRERERADASAPLVSAQGLRPAGTGTGMQVLSGLGGAAGAATTKGEGKGERLAMTPPSRFEPADFRRYKVQSAGDEEGGAMGVTPPSVAVSGLPVQFRYGRMMQQEGADAADIGFGIWDNDLSKSAHAGWGDIHYNYLKRSDELGPIVATDEELAADEMTPEDLRAYKSVAVEENAALLPAKAAEELARAQRAYEEAGENDSITEEEYDARALKFDQAIESAFTAIQKAAAAKKPAQAQVPNEIVDNIDAPNKSFAALWQQWWADPDAIKAKYPVVAKYFERLAK